MSHRLVCIGTSYGGLTALQRLLPALPADFPAPVLIVQHRSRDADHGLLEYLRRRSLLPVREPEDKEPIEVGNVYLAPRDYHLLVEPGEFALSIEAPVTYARPSVDVLFESAADAYRERVVGVILTGANADGAHGLARIKKRGGTCVVQEPADAEASQMPQAAIDAVSPYQVDHMLPLSGIASCLLRLCEPGRTRRAGQS